MKNKVTNKSLKSALAEGIKSGIAKDFNPQLHIAKLKAGKNQKVAFTI